MTKTNKFLLYFTGLLWDMTQSYTSTFIFTGVSIIFSGILALVIALVKKDPRTRSTSESTDITDAAI